MIDIQKDDYLEQILQEEKNKFRFHDMYFIDAVAKLNECDNKNEKKVLELVVDDMEKERTNMLHRIKITVGLLDNRIVLKNQTVQNEHLHRIVKNLEFIYEAMPV